MTEHPCDCPPCYDARGELAAFTCPKPHAVLETVEDVAEYYGHGTFAARITERNPELLPIDVPGRYR